MPAIVPLLILLFFTFVLAPALMFAVAMVAALLVSLLDNKEGSGWGDTPNAPSKLPNDVRGTISGCSVVGAAALILQIAAITIQMRLPWKITPRFSEMVCSTALAVASITLCVAASMLRRRSAAQWRWVSRLLGVSRTSTFVSLGVFTLGRMTVRDAVASALSAPQLDASLATEPQSWLWTLPVAVACLVAAWRVRDVTVRYPCES